MKKKNIKLRRKIFIAMLSSMLLILICMIFAFSFFTKKIKTQEKKSLTDFSEDMKDVYYEDQKYILSKDTAYLLNWITSIAERYVAFADCQNSFDIHCLTLFDYYSNITGREMNLSDDEVLFAYYKDYFFCWNEYTQEYTEWLLNDLYSDLRNQKEFKSGSYPDGVTWLKEVTNDNAYLMTDDAFTSICIDSVNDEYNENLVKFCLIKTNHNKNEIENFSEKIINKYEYIANTNNSLTLHRSIMIISAVIVVIILLCFMYTRKLTGYIADPIELEQIRAQQEKEALEETNRMKTAFLSDASHELKTPLAAMSGYAQNAEIDLANGGNTIIVLEKLKRISSEANRMALMVTQILDATRIEEGRMVLELAPCDIDNLVRYTVENYFAVLNKNNNRLILRIPLELPKVNADSSRLQRVFVNLISNALKHTKNGTILIKAEEEENFVKVTVKDTGSGISEEDMPHIWERYYKGKHSETGTGLGLYICKFIIESHGGTIWAESIKGKGTTFTFTLPLK